ncbi:MAG: hypothetical protein AB2556_25475, partial [Candidatus Thiodiazotropha sp.]
AKTSEDVARAWLKKQAIWQIYLAAPRHIPRPKFDIATPNEVHQAEPLDLVLSCVGHKLLLDSLAELLLGDCVYYTLGTLL